MWDGFILQLLSTHAESNNITNGSFSLQLPTPQASASPHHNHIHALFKPTSCSIDEPRSM